MQRWVLTPGAWLVTALKSAVAEPPASSIFTVPAAKLLLSFDVVAGNAEYVPKAARLPSTPTISKVRRSFRFLSPIPVLSVLGGRPTCLGTPMGERLSPTVGVSPRGGGVVITRMGISGTKLAEVDGSY